MTVGMKEYYHTTFFYSKHFSFNGIGNLLLALLDPEIPSLPGGQVAFGLTANANCA